MLAVAELADRRWAVASRRALHVVDGDEVRRWAWAQIDRGALDAETGTLTVHLVNGTHQVLRLLNSRSSRPFATTFRERVQSSVVCSRTVTVPGGGAVHVTVRRDEDGSLFTQVIGPGTIDLSDPKVAEVVDEAEAQVRESVGLT